MTETIATRKQKFIKLTGDVADVLRSRLVYEGNSVRIGGPRLDPNLYKNVDRVLREFGGKWTAGRTQAHVFPIDPRPLIAEAVGAGKVLDKKQSYQFFETPDDIADRMVALADIRPGMVVLEPSAGKGSIVKAIQRGAQPKAIFAVELDPRHIDTLRDLNCVVIVGDFLTSEMGREGFDRVVMNPPFTDGQDADHIMHAFGLLNPGGRLVAIVGEGTCARTDKKSVAFQAFVQEHIVGEEKLDAGAFRDSGTMTASRIIVLAYGPPTEVQRESAEG